MTTSFVTEAKADCSAFITYRPRAGRVSWKEPSVVLAVETFFPVNVLDAVTVTPGSGARPDLMVPRTMNRVRAIAGACCGDPDALAAGSALMPLAACECEGIEIADIAIAQLRIPSRVREVLRVLIGY